jgi:uncharacterized membrane protein
VALMAIACASSFWIRSSGQLGWIHLLSAWVLACLALAVAAARTGRVGRHRRFVLGAYAGLAGAALGALAPGRLLGGLLWGP